MNEPWYHKTVKNVLIDHMGFSEPSFEVIKWIQGIIDDAPVTLEKNSTMDVWYFIYGFTEKQIMFIINNFDVDFDNKKFYDEFFKKTDAFPNAKEIALKFKEINDLDKAIELCKKEDFDLSLLDFLEGKVNGEKMVNWAVGQVMKEYPKRFAPAEVKEAVMKRFMN